MDMEKADKALQKAKIALMADKNSVFLTTVCLSLRHRWDDTIPTACTNGKEIRYNPDFFMSLTHAEQVFLLLHETMHVALQHVVRLGNRDPNKWNYAADYVINYMLVDQGFTMPAGGLFDAQCKGMSTAEVYKLLPDGLPEMDSDIEPSSGEAGEGIEQEINDILVRASIQAQMSEKPGFIPGEIQVHLNKLTNPVLPWDRILSRFMNKLAKTDYSFRKPNRRFFPDHILPTQHGQSLDDIAVAVDTSGSVTEQQFTQFLSEVHAILLKQKPKKLTLIQFDTRIRSVDELRSTQDLASVEFTGRGGTRIEPVIEWAREHKPVAMIVFTDGYFSNHNPDPKVPLVWMIHSNPNYSTDYGKVITYPLERAA